VRFPDPKSALFRHLSEAALKEIVGQIGEVGQDEGALVIPVKDIALKIMGPAPSVDNKTDLKEYNDEVNILCKKITKVLRSTPLKLDYTGSGRRAKVKIPWVPHSCPTSPTCPTLKLGKDGDYEAEQLMRSAYSYR
jgi:hypothetical protein